MKHLNLLLCPLAAMSMMLMTSCDSEQNEEVTEIIENRGQDQASVPEAFVTGDQVSLSGESAYTLSFDEELLVNIEGEVGELTGQMSISAPFVYESEQDLAVAQLSVLVPYDDGFNEDLTWMDTVQRSSDMRSDNDELVARTLNSIYRDEGYTNTHFDVDADGRLYVVQNITLLLDGSETARLIISGSKVLFNYSQNDAFVITGYTVRIGVSDDDERLETSRSIVLGVDTL